MTFTKEQLISAANARMEFAEMMMAKDLLPLQIRNWSIELELARIALASLEAESKPRQPELSHVIYHFRDWNEGFPIERFKADYVISWMLANYPPAQPAAVSVPDFDEWSRKCDLQIALCDPELREKARYIWDEACRAAMLQGAAGNSPVIPDGWKLVPVEPTQAMIDAHIGGVQSGGMQKGYRAMLAAAPDFRENAETSTNCPCCGRKPLKNRKCSVAGCEGRHVAHGLCQKHYDIEHKNNLSRRQGIREANKKYRARKSAAPQQEVKS